ncbi:MAG: DUF2510 domain-containing protein [Actinomycetota bacterium]
MTDPGWYHAQGDPADTMRYWDGTQWVGEPTAQTAASEPPSGSTPPRANETIHMAAPSVPPSVQPPAVSPPSVIPASAASPVPAAQSAGSLPAADASAGLPEPGALFSDAWAGAKANLARLFGITIGAAIASVVAAVAIFAFAISQIDDDFFDFDFGDAIAIILLSYLVALVVFWMITSIHSLMTARLLLVQHRGYAPSMDDAWTKTKQRFWGYFGTSLAIYIGVYIGIVIVLAILIAITPVLAILGIPLVVFTWVKLGFLPIAAAATPRGASMVSASSSISEGRFWPVLGRMLIVSLPLIGLWILSIALSAGSDPNGMSDSAAAILLLAWVIVGPICFFIYSSGLTRLYIHGGGQTEL